MVFYMWEQGAIYLITFNKYIPLVLIQFPQKVDYNS